MNSSAALYDNRSHCRGCKKNRSASLKANVCREVCCSAVTCLLLLQPAKAGMSVHVKRRGVGECRPAHPDRLCGLAGPRGARRPVLWAARPLPSQTALNFVDKPSGEVQWDRRAQHRYGGWAPRARGRWDRWRTGGSRQGRPERSIKPAFAEILCKPKPL